MPDENGNVTAEEIEDRLVALGWKRERARRAVDVAFPGTGSLAPGETLSTRFGDDITVAAEQVLETFRSQFSDEITEVESGRMTRREFAKYADPALLSGDGIVRGEPEVVTDEERQDELQAQLERDLVDASPEVAQKLGQQAEEEGLETERVDETLRANAASIELESSHFGSMAEVNGYESAAAMAEVVRGKLASSPNPELKDLAIGLGDDFELLTFATNPEQLSTFVGADDLLADVFRAPIQRRQIKYRNSDGAIEEYNINEWDFDRVINLGYDELTAGALYESIGKTGIPGSQAAKVAPYIGIIARGQGVLDRYNDPNRHDEIRTAGDFAEPGQGPNDFGPEGSPGSGGSFLGDLFNYEGLRTKLGLDPEPPTMLGFYSDPTMEAGAHFEDVSKEFNSYLTRFNGHEELALLAAHSREGRMAAEEIFNFGTPQSQRTVGTVREIIDSYDSDELAQAGLGQGYFGAQALKNLFTVGGEAAEARSQVSVTLPDPEGVNDAIEQVYRGILLADPTDAELSLFRGQIEGLVTSRAQQAQSQVAGGDDYNFWKNTGGKIITGETGVAEVLRQYTTNVQAQALKAVEQTEAYKRLYANKPSGIDPLTYASAFRSKVNQQLGEADAIFALDAQRRGMEQGDLRTSTGRAAFSKQGEKSMTLKERWASKADVFKRMI